jgi:hypothetical protein
MQEESRVLAPTNKILTWYSGMERSLEKETGQKKPRKRKGKKKRVREKRLKQGIQEQEQMGKSYRDIQVRPIQKPR